MVGHPDVPVLRFPGATAPRPGTLLAGHRVEASDRPRRHGRRLSRPRLRLGRLVALKVIAPELLEDATVQRRFLEEAVTAASFEHPNVVPVYDAGESDGIAYMVMRYVHGMDLCAMTCAWVRSNRRAPPTSSPPSATRWTPCTAPGTCTATSSPGTC